MDLPAPLFRSNTSIVIKRIVEPAPLHQGYPIKPPGEFRHGHRRLVVGFPPAGVAMAGRHRVIENTFNHLRDQFDGKFTHEEMKNIHLLLCGFHPQRSSKAGQGVTAGGQPPPAGLHSIGMSQTVKRIARQVWTVVMVVSCAGSDFFHVPAIIDPDFHDQGCGIFLPQNSLTPFQLLHLDGPVHRIAGTIVMAGDDDGL